MPTFLDRVKFNVSGTPGTGNVTIGTAVSTFQLPAAAGGVTGDILPITFVDGTAWEESYCYFDATAGTLARTLLRSSTGSLLSLSSSAVGAVTMFARDAGTKSNSMVFLGQQVLGAAAASIDFTSIPADYEDLIISIEARGDAAAANIEARMRFNNDSGSNYYWEYFVSNSGGQTGAGGSSGASSYVLVGFPPAATGPSGEAAAIQIEIPNYARTSFNKSMTIQEQHRISTATNGSNQTTFGASWLSTAAINRITIYPSSGNFAAGTVVNLYARARSNGAGSNDPTLFLIHDQTLASSAATYDITDIPQTYEDLVIMVEARQTANAVIQWNLRPNNDSGANYVSYVENRFGTGSTTTEARFGCAEASGTTAGVYGFTEGIIFGYSKTARFKSFQSRGFYPSASFEDRNEGVWKSNAAITSLRLFPGANSFDVGTRIRVYGRKPSLAASIASSPPWWLKPPMASSFSLIGTVTPTLTDDVDEGLLLDMGTPVNTDAYRGAVRTITTPTGDWTLVVKFKALAAMANYVGFGIMLYDTAAARVINFRTEWNTGTTAGLPLIVNRGTYPTGYNSNPYTANHNILNETWLRVRHIGTTNYFDISPDGKQWLNAYSESDTAWLTNRANRVGIGGFYNRLTGNLLATIPYFSLTGPGV